MYSKIFAAVSIKNTVTITSQWSCSFETSKKSPADIENLLTLCKIQKMTKMLLEDKKWSLYIK